MNRRGSWYQNAIIYCLDVETFADSNGDGIGDFRGLTSRLDYLAGLGINTLWLMPFYPSPGKDDGYDVADYTTVDPRYGSMADFSEFVEEAKERGLRLVIDMIPNHTSDQHPWFQAAREDPESKYFDYYVWRDDDPGDTSDQVVFPGEQDGIWTYDKKVRKWYLHHFHAFQPDLNFTNPDVQDEFERFMGMWLSLGVDGFRIDAAPFLISLTGVDTGGIEMSAAHQFLEDMRDFVTARKGHAILLGEVDVGLSAIADFFGGGNQLHALFNFPMNRYTFLGLAQESADPINFGLTQIPSIPNDGQWVNFLRHHDELNLSSITKDQQRQIYAAFGPEEEHQVYNRGLRRRLAPMLGGDLKRLKVAYSLLFSLPGAPMIFYGEEIGMWENLEMERRMAVRAPMQWTPWDSGGFSSVPVEDLVRPILTDGDYGYPTVNVSSQRGDPDSLLNWMASLTRVRKECGEIGAGEWSLVETGCDPVFALRYDNDEGSVLVLNNLSSDTQQAATGLTEDERKRTTVLFSAAAHDLGSGDSDTLELDGYGFCWMRIGGVY